MNHTTAMVVVGKTVLGAGLALGLAVAPHVAAHPRVGYDAYAVEVGDDNADGRITEDESGWDCRVMGNRICGPGNAQDAIPGDYTTVHADGTPAWPTGHYPY